MRARLLRYLGPTVALVIFVAALSRLSRELRGDRLRDVLQELAGIPPAQLALALLFTAGSYLVLTGYDAVSVRYVRRRLPYRRVALASFINYAFSQTLGFPLLTGGAVRYRLYSGWGLSAVQVTNVVAFATFSFWLGVLVVGGTVFLAAPALVAPQLGLPTAAARPLGLVALAIAGAYLTWTYRGRRLVHIRDWRFLRPSSRLALGQLAVACVDWLLAASVLYALLPAGHGVGFPAFLAVFLVAFVAGIASNVPGGIGVFETIVLVLLPEHLRETGVLGALVAYRAIYNLLPLVVAALSLGAYETLRRREGLARLAGTAFGRWTGVLTPEVLAVTAFLGGVALLVAGAVPTTADGALPAWLGAPWLSAAAHVLASAVGAGVVLLAAGLHRRLDAAWRLTVALLGAGIALSLAGGTDVVTAVLVALVLAALLPARRHFYRTASVWADPIEPTWTAAVALVLVGTAWIGVFAHGLAAPGDVPWWRLVLSADAPRWLRAMLGVVVVTALVGALHLARRPRGRPAAATPAELERVRAVAAASPSAVAHLALLGDKSLLFGADGRAFLAYAVHGDSFVALGDPVGPAAEATELVWQFAELAARNGGRPAFYLVGETHRAHYLDVGLALFELGEEARVPLSASGLAPAGGAITETAMAAARSGLRFDVEPPPRVDALLPELRAVSDRWRAATGGGEHGFALGAFRDDYVRRLPVAVLRRGERVVAFALLWPGAGREELGVDLLRHDPELAPADAPALLVAEIVRWADAEGYRWCDLGMAPAGHAAEPMPAPLAERVGALHFRLGEHFADPQALRAFKERFAPVWTPRYLAAPAGLALPRVVADVAALVAGDGVTPPPRPPAPRAAATTGTPAPRPPG